MQLFLNAALPSLGILALRVPLKIFHHVPRVERNIHQNNREGTALPTLVFETN